MGMPAVELPTDELNQQVILSAPPGLNTFKINSGVRLLVEVTGSETIIFPADFGIRPFRYENEEWVEVEQVPTTYAHGDVVLPPSEGNPLVTGVAHTFPILPDTDRPVLLRIFVFGHVYRDGTATNEEVGGYIDVVLEP
ncbi:MAG: hypothetical protein AB1449_09770 [Chloroflexota bacterium]